ncbi:pyrimidine reductase family protein [Actinomycetospora sp. TBRC 11914]|uniref:pyrimidine reductase family protein n=1 Tax=Actinomycetospora sp. TBRC 11914 TaxID=2729387 RepID=UPI001B7D68C3|nr:pyrimidine reductase family protein [Actinomycetospora sp. TBRC 11914]
MHQVWPLPARPIDEDALEELYRYPVEDVDGSRWVAVNFVSSLDGGIEVDGRSAGLSTPADRRVFALGHDLADVVLLGSGTALAEDYPGLRPDARSAERRRRHGLSEAPPLAVVTSGTLPADATSLVDVLVPSIVVTSTAASAEAQEAWRAAGARVLLAGDAAVDLPTALARLAEDGFRRIDCEGGPGLVGTLLHDDLVDEVRLSIAPLAVAGKAGRVASSVEPLEAPRGFEVASLLVDEDGTLLVRYVRAGLRR